MAQMGHHDLLWPSGAILFAFVLNDLPLNEVCLVKCKLLISL